MVVQPGRAARLLARLDVRMMSQSDRINGYRCQTCGYLTVTIDVDQGVTPFMIDCPGGARSCGAVAVSLGYPKDIPPHWAEPKYEWYRPSLAWARRKGPDMLNHVQRGGLVFRKREMSQVEADENCCWNYFRMLCLGERCKCTCHGEVE